MLYINHPDLLNTISYQRLAVCWVTNFLTKDTKNSHVLYSSVDPFKPQTLMNLASVQADVSRCGVSQHGCYDESQLPSECQSLGADPGAVQIQVRGKRL